MRFEPTPLKGAYIIDLQRLEDDRGFFARTFCGEEFAKHGLATSFAQCNVSYNRRKGTLRGMHFQVPPYAEAKLVRCVRGRIHDCIVDLRRSSPTFLNSFVIELDDESRRALYVPEGFAHGFQTLTDDAEVFYQMSTPFVGGAARGLRFDDPKLGLEWPLNNRTISEKDLSYAPFSASEFP